MEGVLNPIDYTGNSPGPKLKPLAKNLMAALRAGNNEALQREFETAWPNYLHVEVSKARIAVIRDIATGPGLHTMFVSLMSQEDKRKQLTAMELATFMCVVDDMLGLLLSHAEFLPTLTRMLWNKEDIPADHRGAHVPAVHVRRAAVVALSFIVREPSRPPIQSDYLDGMRFKARLVFLEKMCDLGIPAAAIANLNDKEGLNDSVLVGKGMLVIRTICSGADVKSGGSLKCRDTLEQLRAFEAIAQHAILPSNLRPFMLSVVETLAALAVVLGVEKLVSYPGMLNSLETLWVMRQAPDPPKKFGEPWDGNRIVGNSAASLINYIMKQQGKDPPITSIQAYQPNTENKTKPEKDCYCGYCGRPPNVQGMGGTPPFFRWCRCSRCVVTRYCSKKCRENHWKFGHWNECTPLWLVP